jgi:hypothetical protein
MRSRAFAALGFVVALAVVGPSPVRADTESSRLARLLADFRQGATPAQFDKMRTAVLASPSLKAQLERLASAGRLKRIELVPRNDQRLAGTPFAARAVNDELIMTAAFLDAQAPARLFDVVGPEDVLPDNLVFVLGHLAQHLEHPLTLGSDHLTREAFIALKSTDEARAYIVGWNDMAEAALGSNKPSVPRVGSMIMNFRYRTVFLRVEKVDEAVISSSGKIEPSQHDVGVLAKALETTNLPDFD